MTANRDSILMPIYAYQCESCGNEFDLKQSFDSDPQHPCPRCESIGRRRFSAPTVIYKGSGFYTTDYARKSVDVSSGSSAPTPPASSSSSDAKSDAKTESTSASSKSADSASKAPSKTD